MIKVAFLFDRSNDWLAEFLPNYGKKFPKFKFSQIYDEQKIRRFDITFVLGYTKILRGDIINANNLLLVVHESDLPNGRGFSPLQWQVLAGENKITVSLLKVSKDYDAGDLCDTVLLELDGTELYDELRYKQAKATFNLIENFLVKYPDNNFRKQVGKPSTYPRRTPADSKLDIDKTIRDQFNLLRICNNQDWPAFFEISGVKYTLKIEKIG